MQNKQVIDLTELMLTQIDIGWFPPIGQTVSAVVTNQPILLVKH